MSDDKLYKTFTITQLNGTQHTVIVDADRYDEVIKYKWYVVKKGNKYYAARTVKSRGARWNVYLHHFIIGNPPTGCVTDHRNCDGLDNRIGNLRFCTKSENALNRSCDRDNTSGFKGVTRTRKGKTRPWVARAQLHRKYYDLGLFETPEAAHAAYCEFARQHHGEFFNPGIRIAEANQS